MIVDIIQYYYKSNVILNIINIKNNKVIMKGERLKC